LLPPVREAVRAIARAQSADRALEGEYAVTLARAAIAAAQDERGEMELLLAHARDLAERVASRGGAAVWPRSFNLAAGELWFEVDRFDEARAAYARAAQASGGSAALAGLARAAQRLGDQDGACRAYRQMTDGAPSLARERADFLRRCP
jgi:tetratricopeptide (TPR) repeat protein